MYLSVCGTNFVSVLTLELQSGIWWNFIWISILKWTCTDYILGKINQKEVPQIDDLFNLYDDYISNLCAQNSTKHQIHNTHDRNRLTFVFGCYHLRGCFEIRLFVLNRWYLYHQFKCTELNKNWGLAIRIWKYIVFQFWL